MKRRDALQILSAWAGTSLLLARAMSMKSSSPIVAVTDGSAPQPFHISFDKDRIKDLQYRLDHMIWPEMPFDTGWSAGTNDQVLKDLVQYWQHEYDWYKEQEKLNQLPHYPLPVEEEQLHYVHYIGRGSLAVHLTTTHYSFARNRLGLSLGVPSGKILDWPAPLQPIFYSKYFDHEMIPGDYL